MRPIIKMPDEALPFFFGESQGLRQLLIDAVGAYCAYCESPLGVDVAASRKVSASNATANLTIAGTDIRTTIGIQSRRFMTAWANLLPSCVACVAAKGEVPGSELGLSLLRQDDVDTFDALIAGGVSPLRLSDVHADLLFGYSLRNWVWPDEAANEDGEIVLEGDPTSEMFTYEQSAQSMTDLAARNLVRLSIEEAADGWVQTTSTQVWVIPNTTWIGQQSDGTTLLRRVQATILGLNLNLHNPSDPVAADRRVALRTAAATVAVGCLADLATVVTDVRSRGASEDPNDDLDDKRVEAFLSVARESLRTTGFWSVWLRLFAASILENPQAPWNNYSVDARQSLLYQMFVQYEIDLRRLGAIRPSKDAPIGLNAPNDDIFTLMVLPGTDLGRLPLWP